MTNESEAKIRVRGFVGRNVARLLDARGWDQDALAQLVKQAGLKQWDSTVVSRVASGERALNLEEALVLAAVFKVPIVELLHGDGEVVLAGSPVPTDQLRDVVTTGRIADAHRGNSLLDELTAADEEVSPLAVQIATELGVTPAEVEATAVLLWSLPVDDELALRMAESEKKYTGTDPRTSITLGITQIPVEPRRRRAWRGHNIKAMTDEIRVELRTGGTYKRRRR